MTDDVASVLVGAYGEPMKFQLRVSALPPGSVDALEFEVLEWGGDPDGVVLGRDAVKDVYEFLARWLGVPATTPTPCPAGPDCDSCHKNATPPATALPCAFVATDGTGRVCGMAEGAQMHDLFHRYVPPAPALTAARLADAIVKAGLHYRLAEARVSAERILAILAATPEEATR